MPKSMLTFELKTVEFSIAIIEKEMIQNRNSRIKVNHCSCKKRN